MDKNAIFSLLAVLLHEPASQTIFFEEILEKIPRDNAESLLIRVIPLLTQEKSWHGFSRKKNVHIDGYALAFGSSGAFYATSSALQEIFTQYFGEKALKTAASLYLPLVRVFLRKSIIINPQVLEEIEKLQLFWSRNRQLGKHKESIVYFIYERKLIRVDSERSSIQKKDIERIREKLLQQYPHLEKRDSQYISFHEIFLAGKTSQSLLLPNTNELLTDIEKDTIRNALIAAPDSPKAFAKKLEELLSFSIPLLSDLTQEEIRLYPHVLQGSVFAFISALDSVVRWSKQPEEGSFQESRNPNIIETDLDHTIAMLSMASDIFTSQHYPFLAHALDEKKVMNGIFVHDGGEPFSPFGDVTHADEERWQNLHESKDEAENKGYTSWWQKRMKLHGLKKELLHDVYASFTNEQIGSDREGVFVKFLDHFQAVVYGISHIYPYEEVYKNPQAVVEYIKKYALSDTVRCMQLLSPKEQEDLKQFFMNKLKLSEVGSAYEEAVTQKRLDESLAEQLVAAITQTLSALYASKSTKEFIKEWEKTQSF